MREDEEGNKEAGEKEMDGREQEDVEKDEEDTWAGVGWKNGWMMKDGGRELKSKWWALKDEEGWREER